MRYCGARGCCCCCCGCCCHYVFTIHTSFADLVPCNTCTSAARSTKKVRRRSAAFSASYVGCARYLRQTLSCHARGFDARKGWAIPARPGRWYGSDRRPSPRPIAACPLVAPPQTGAHGIIVRRMYLKRMQNAGFAARSMSAPSRAWSLTVKGIQSFLVWYQPGRNVRAYSRPLKILWGSRLIGVKSEI